jgi:GT2 family glycosyltransferase
MKLPKIGAVVVNYNNPDSTRETLSSLMQQGNKKEFELKIYLVNNGCTDRDSANLAEEFKSAILIESKTNLGFAGGNNLGIKKAMEDGCEYLLIVNNDVTILSDNFFESLLGFPADITAPLIEYKQDGRVIHDFGGQVDYLFGRNAHLHSKGEADYYSGACLFVKRKVFEKLKGFDDKFFLYYEDVDFCLRAKYSGFSLGLNLEVKVFHLLSDSTNKLGSKKIKILATSHLLFCRKHLSFFCFPLYVTFNLFLRIKSFFP